MLSHTYHDTLYPKIMALSIGMFLIVFGNAVVI